MNIKDLVKGQMARFEYYRDGELWYKTDGGFMFPVPISDKKEVGNATFMAEYKAITLMRYIRKYKEEMDKEATEGCIQQTQTS